MWKILRRQCHQYAELYYFYEFEDSFLKWSLIFMEAVVLFKTWNFLPRQYTLIKCQMKLFLWISICSFIIIWKFCNSSDFLRNVLTCQITLFLWIQSFSLKTVFQNAKLSPKAKRRCSYNTPNETKPGLRMILKVPTEKRSFD